MSLSRVILPSALLRAGGAATKKGDSIFGKVKKKINK